MLICDPALWNRNYFFTVPVPVPSSEKLWFVPVQTFEKIMVPVPVLTLENVNENFL